MYKLAPKSVLDDGKISAPGLEITEIDVQEIVSLAIAQGEAKQFNSMFKKQFGKLPPNPGKMFGIKGGYAFWTAPDQIMLVLNGLDPRADEKIAAKFSKCAYATLQTDGWLHLSVAGENVQSLWERFVPVDYKKFEAGDAVRTQAHHMALMVLCMAKNEYRFLTPRSTAQSFMSALKHITD